MDAEEPQEPVLPHFFPEGQNDSIPRIERSTFLDLLNGMYNDQYDHKLIIDCRFEYEYEGGHINEAINYNDKELLATHLFRTPMEGRTLIVFHCEYSAHRAPLMARHIRAEDRTANAELLSQADLPRGLHSGGRVQRLLFRSTPVGATPRRMSKWTPLSMPSPASERWDASARIGRVLAERRPSPSVRRNAPSTILRLRRAEPLLVILLRLCLVPPSWAVVSTKLGVWRRTDAQVWVSLRGFPTVP